MTTTTADPAAPPAGPMAHRQLLEALSGLLLGLFVTILSSTVVSTRCRGSSPTWAAASPRTPGWSPRRCSR